MAIRHRETTSFEVYEGNNNDYIVEFRCPQCQGPILAAETEQLEGGFEAICDNCDNEIKGYFRLIMDWD